MSEEGPLSSVLGAEAGGPAVEGGAGGMGIGEGISVEGVALTKPKEDCRLCRTSESKNEDLLAKAFCVAWCNESPRRLVAFHSQPGVTDSLRPC